MLLFDPAALGAALNSLKAVIDLARNANDAQLALKISGEIANIQGKLIDVQQYTLTLQEENQKLRDEIRSMTQLADEEKKFTFMHGVYWKTQGVLSLREDEQGNRITELHWEGPFCPLCKDGNGKAVRLKHVGSFSDGSLKWDCELHKGTYKAPAMQP